MGLEGGYNGFNNISVIPGFETKRAAKEELRLSWAAARKAEAKAETVATENLRAIENTTIAVNMIWVEMIMLQTNAH